MSGEHLSGPEVHEYVDGLLDRDSAARAQAHAAVCERCAAELRATEAIVSWSRQSRDAHRAPPELWPRVVAATSEYPLMRQLVLRRMRGALIAAALALVALTAITAVGITRWRLNREPPRTLEQRLEQAYRRAEALEREALEQGEALPPPAPAAPAAPGPGGPRQPQ